MPSGKCGRKSSTDPRRRNSGPERLSRPGVGDAIELTFNYMTSSDYEAPRRKGTKKNPTKKYH